MNLFIIGWNLPEEYKPRVLPELKKMAKIYTRLDPETIWHQRNTSCSLFCALMHSANETIFPRQYKSEIDNQVVFYSGLPVSSIGSFPAHRAEALHSNWGKLTENLEGMYCIVRVTYNPLSLELITDPIGMEQVYYYHQDNLWLISNSVRLIEQISKKSTLDPYGISLFLSTGWIGDDCTLRSDINVIPGGQCWVWREGNKEPKQYTYYSPSRLSRLTYKALTPTYLKHLSLQFIQTLQSLNQGFNQITCAITGGRDTRFVTSLLIHTALPVLYYTFGESSGTDHKIATLIVNTLNLPYQFISIDKSDVIRYWDTLSKQIVMQSDGMANIDLIPSVIANLSLDSGIIKRIDLGGTGGELLKGFYSTPDLNLFLKKYDITSIKNYLANKIVNDFGHLLRQECIELSRDFIDRFVTQYIDYGFNPSDIPDVFFLYSRLRRRRGINKRALAQYQDFFSPFICRIFLEAAFSIPTYQRCLEPLHYHIIRLMSPKLHSFPLDKGKWYCQQPIINLIQFYKESLKNKINRRILNFLNHSHTNREKNKKLHMATDMFDQTGWFEAKRKQIRSMCLERPNSLIWQFANRSIFEKITSPKTTPEECLKYGKYITQIYRIATLFYYENSLE